MCKVPELRIVISALKKTGWINIGGTLHDKWIPPAGVLTTDGKSHVAIPRCNCKSTVLKRIIKQSGLKF